jgi:hypothetical protein
MAVLFDLSLVCGQSKLTATEAERKAVIYFEALREYPADVVSAAARRHWTDDGAEGRFFPHPGRLLALCREVLDGVPARAKREDAESIRRVGGHSDEEWRSMVAGFKRYEIWPAGVGPMPGSPGCGCPGAIMIEMGYT